MAKRIHISMQSGGGTGKSTGMLLSCEVCHRRNIPYLGIDLDWAKRTLSEFGYRQGVENPGALVIQYKDIRGANNRVDPIKLGAVFEALSKLEADNLEVFCDTGATTLEGFKAWFKDGGLSFIQGQLGMDVVLHTWVTGGADRGATFLDCKRLYAPEYGDLPIYVWVNEFDGPLVIDDRYIWQTPFFQGEDVRRRTRFIWLPASACGRDANGIDLVIRHFGGYNARRYQTFKADIDDKATTMIEGMYLSHYWDAMSRAIADSGLFGDDVRRLPNWEPETLEDNSDGYGSTRGIFD